VTATQRDPEATRSAILEAAESVFLEKGFGAAAVSEIAQRAGVTKSLIHHHFGSKEKLWEEIKLRRFTVYAERQMAMLHEQEPTPELLRQSMETYFRFLAANPEIVRILAWMFLEKDGGECADMDRELTRAGVEKIRAGQEKGTLRADLNPAFILFSFLGIAQHWFQDKEWILGHLGLSPSSTAVDEAYLVDAVKIFFEGVLPR